MRGAVLYEPGGVRVENRDDPETVAPADERVNRHSGLPSAYLPSGRNHRKRAPD